MIAYLKGKIIQKTDKAIILLCQEIGYQIYLTPSLIPEMETGGETDFFIHHHLREEASDLYGFKTFTELEFFQQLISISGIGPKVALEILSLNPEKVKAAISQEDLVFITQIPGIGTKTAKRIILELKGKVSITDLNYKSQSLSVDTDIIEALLSLGYQRKHVQKILKDMPEELEKEQEIITYFLKHA